MFNRAARPDHDQRQALRREVALPGTVRRENAPLDIAITDISRTGLRARCPAPLPLGAHVTVGAVGMGRIAAEVVWADHPHYGLRFDREVAANVVHTIHAASNIVVLPQHEFRPGAQPALTECQPGVSGIAWSLALAIAATCGALLAGPRARG